MGIGDKKVGPDIEVVEFGAAMARLVRKGSRGSSGCERSVWERHVGRVGGEEGGGEGETIVTSTTSG